MSGETFFSLGHHAPQSFLIVESVPLDPKHPELCPCERCAAERRCADLRHDLQHAGEAWQMMIAGAIAGTLLLAALKFFAWVFW